MKEGQQPVLARPGGAGVAEGVRGEGCQWTAEGGDRCGLVAAALPDLCHSLLHPRYLLSILLKSQSHLELGVYSHTAFKDIIY